MPVYFDMLDGILDSIKNADFAEAFSGVGESISNAVVSGLDFAINVVGPKLVDALEFSTKFIGDVAGSISNMASSSLVSI